jgi:hypothetical protein
MARDGTIDGWGSGQSQARYSPVPNTILAKVTPRSFNRTPRRRHSLTLHQNGNDINGPRISSTVAERKEISLSPNILEQYVGTYEIRPGVNVIITMEGNQLFTQVTGQEKIPLFAESETKFFLKIVDSQHEYLKNDKGVVTHVIIRQGPNEIKAPRK